MTALVPDPIERARVLTALYITQEQEGCLTPDGIRRVAERLGMPENAVFSTASFYSLYRTRPSGMYILQVCTGLSCWLAGGAERLVDFLEQKLQIKVGETTEDGLFTLETVECLASCGTAPVMRVNDELYEDLTVDKVDLLVDQLVVRAERRQAWTQS